MTKRRGVTPHGLSRHSNWPRLISDAGPVLGAATTHEDPELSRDAVFTDPFV